ncbi:MAG: hypothetical protein IT343_10155 [Candidatus Melainabacteria bacterium]|jgi:type II secretory pathway component PulM|nr:hypothetical protein [Candidatus Melainabacteria bacterium]
MSAETGNKASGAFDQIKEFVLIFGGNFVVLILLLVVVNYFLAPFDIKSHLDAVSQEIHQLRQDIGTIARDVRELKAHANAAKAAK